MIFTTIVTVAGVAVVLGVKELPKYSRIFGRFAGKSLKLLQDARNQLLQQKNDSEWGKVAKDLTEGIQEVAGIRSELRQGLRVRSADFVVQQQIQEQIQQTQQLQQAPTASAAFSSFSESSEKQQEQQQMIIPQEKSTSLSSSSSSSHTRSSTAMIRPSIAQAFSQAHSFSTHQVSTSSSSSSSVPSSTTAAPSAAATTSVSSSTSPNNAASIPSAASSTSSRAYSAYSYPPDVKLSKAPRDPRVAPFSNVSFGQHRYIQELADSDINIPTERVGSGADLIALDLLERNFAKIQNSGDSNAVAKAMQQAMSKK